MSAITKISPFILIYRLKVEPHIKQTTTTLGHMVAFLYKIKNPHQYLDGPNIDTDFIALRIIFD